MQPRFKENLDNFEDVKEYFINRAIQILGVSHYDGVRYVGFRIKEIFEYETGVVAIFERQYDKERFASIYVYNRFRDQGVYKTLARLYNLPILTSNDCNIASYLRHKKYEFVELNVRGLVYNLVSNYYGLKKANRTGVYYMNHIDEGLCVLSHIDSGFNAKMGYMLHPIFQMDDDLKENYNLAAIAEDIPHVPLVYAMEYRSVANEYLSKRSINSIDEIRLSPLNAVNEMLIADKIQNRKDFELYHKDKHPRSAELDKYFKNWLNRLNISEERYQQIKQDLIVSPVIHTLM